MHEVIIEFLGKVFQGWQSVLPSRGPPYIRIPWTSDVDTFLGGCESAKKKKNHLVMKTNEVNTSSLLKPSLNLLPLYLYNQLTGSQRIVIKNHKACS